VAGDEQQQGSSDEFGIGELFAGHQAAKQVVGRLGALVGHQLAQIFFQVPHRRRHALRRPLAAGYRRPVALEPVAVGVGNTEQFTDYQGGQRLREDLNQVRGRPLPFHVVEQAHGELLDSRLELLHATHGELAGEQPPVARVVGRVHPHEEPGRERHPPLSSGLRCRRVVKILPGAEAPVGEHGAHTGITGHQPAEMAVGEGHAANRGLGSPLPQHPRGIKIVLPLGG
jgi:hypothetical protein